MTVKKFVGAVAAAAMLVCLVPATSAVAAEETAAPNTTTQTNNTCSVTLEVNGYRLVVPDANGRVSCGDTLAKAVATYQSSFNIDFSKQEITGWKIDNAGMNVKTSAPLNSEEFQAPHVLVAQVKDKPAVPQYATVHFVNTLTGNDYSSTDKAVFNDTLLKYAPTVTENGYTFAGWTYDQAGQKPVGQNDPVTGGTVIYVYAQWTKNAEPQPVAKTLVTFEVNGKVVSGGFVNTGSKLSDVYNTKKAEIQGKIPAGKVIARWTDKATSKVYTTGLDDWDAVATGDRQVLVAFFEDAPVNHSTITYKDSISGKTYTTNIVEYWKPVLSDAFDVAKDGYTFAGWTYDREGKIPVAKGDVASKDTYEIWAQWKKTPKTLVTFSVNGKSISGGFVNTGSKLGDLYNAKKAEIQGKIPAGKVITRWTDKATHKVYTTDLTDWDAVATGDRQVLVAFFDDAPAEYFTVTYKDSLTGKTYLTNRVKNGGKVLSDSFDVAKKGYTFAGWSYDQEGKSPVLKSDFVSHDTVVYAQWKATYYTVTYKDSLTGKTYTTNRVKFGGKVLSDSFDVAKKGYTFAGWTFDKKGKKAVTDTAKVRKDVTVWAQWTKKKVYTINYADSMTGKVYTSNQITEGGKYLDIHFEVAKKGYTFNGWTFDREGHYPVNADAVVNDEYVNAFGDTIYAQWKQDNARSVTFIWSDDEGTNHISRVNVVEGTKLTEDQVPVPGTRTGYKFKGWFAQTGHEFDINEPVTANYVYTARWTKVVPAAKLTPAQKNAKKATKKAKAQLSQTGSAVLGVSAVAVIAMIGAGVVLTLRKRA
ncbi:InlB B-repeat-containing protein [Bifidobacterium platyrrhinorum]|nr:InlB B-repeat-containing protein [Bifidobacterium platyrrhinorum]